jgi:nitroreductase
MEVFEAIAKRRSVRKYLEQEVPELALRKILEAARLAPSANNRQDWRFIVIRDQGQRRRLGEASGQPFVGTAPVIIAGMSLNPNRLMSCEVPSYAVDLAIAMTNITLVAIAEGLGTCWIGAFDQGKVKTVLSIPSEYKVVELMTIGFPADEPREKVRKSLFEVVSYDRFEIARKPETC